MFSQVAWQILFSKFLCTFSNVTFCVLFLLCNLNWNVHLSLLEQISLPLSLSLFFHDWGGCLLLCKYLSMGSGAFGAPPSLFSLLQWSPRVWSCAYEFLPPPALLYLSPFYVHHSEGCIPTPCFLLPLPFFFLSLQRMGKLQALSNSKYISGTIGMPGHPPLPSYLHIFIWKCPSGAVLFLEKPHKLQGLVICCRGPCVMGCVVGLVVLHTSSLWPFPHCLVRM